MSKEEKTVADRAADKLHKEAEAKEDRKERRVLAELIASFVLWFSCGMAAMILWYVCFYEEGAAAHELLGLWATVTGMCATCKPMLALILTCRERIKERRKRKEEP